MQFQSGRGQEAMKVLAASSKLVFGSALEEGFVILKRGGTLTHSSSVSGRKPRVRHTPSPWLQDTITFLYALTNRALNRALFLLHYFKSLMSPAEKTFHSQTRGYQTAISNEDSPLLTLISLQDNGIKSLQSVSAVKIIKEMWIDYDNSIIFRNLCSSFAFFLLKYGLYLS